MVLFDSKKIPGYARFRIPGMITTKSGAVLAYCEARKEEGDWSAIDILMRTSTDGGKTFSSPVLLACGTKNSQTVNNPVMIASRGGTVHFLYCVEYGVLERGGAIFYRKSADDGVTWTAPRELSAMTVPELRSVFATGPGHGIELTDGTLFVPCWTVLKAHGQPPESHHPGSVCALISNNGGSTWAVTPFVPDGEATDPNETAAAQLPDGTVVLSVRDGKTHYRCASYSKNGVSFTPIVRLPNLPDPVCSAGMLAVGDTLYLSHCDDIIFRRRLTLCRSRDGIIWSKVCVIERGNAGYSDIASLEDRLLILYEKGRNLLLKKAMLIQIPENY